MGWVEANLDYDSTLSYADHAGFRCGTCFPYQLFDVINRKPINLIEYPLIAMESSVLDKRYMDLDHRDAYDFLIKMRRACDQVGGTFSLLWHNERLIDQLDIELYLSIIS